MHSEFYTDREEEQAEKINATKERGGRDNLLWEPPAAGRWSLRQMKTDDLKACSGWTEIFIYPGYQFKDPGWV